MAEKVSLRVRYLPGDGSEVKTWKQLMEVYRDLGQRSQKAGGPRWIFRGEGAVRRDRALRPSLQRVIEKYGLKAEDSSDFEGRLLREFKRKAHHYLATVPDADDTLEWLALMRHHGAPTRLLDWTYSFFVAVYFACEDNPGPHRGDGAEESRPCVVYALDTRQCVRGGKRQLAAVLALSSKEIDNPEYDALYVDGTLESRERFDRAMMCSRTPVIYPVNPFRLNERLVIQQGLFTCPGDVSRGFFENLVGMPETEVRAIRIAGGDTVRKCLAELQRMNMNRAVLYPGLDGFASSLATRLADPDTLGKQL